MYLAARTENFWHLLAQQESVLLAESAELPLISEMSCVTALQVIALPSASAIALIRGGLPSGAFDVAAKTLALTRAELASKLGISARTLRDQRKRKVRLSPENTEKLVRVARIQALGRTLFSTDAAVAEWLSSPAPALDGTKPIDLLDTETGARAIESVLHGLAYGNVM